jgi:hypothetical protein
MIINNGTDLYLITFYKINPKRISTNPKKWSYIAKKNQEIKNFELGWLPQK